MFLIRKVLRAPEGAHAADVGQEEGSAAVFPSSPEERAALLARLSRSELCAYIETQAEEVISLRRLITPFKVENVRLAKSLRQSQARIKDAMTLIREFFADRNQRELLKSMEKDDSMRQFLQRLIKWYRSMNGDADPMLDFYRKIWAYERGEGEPTVATESVSTEANRESSNVDSALNSSRLLYDACQARTENTRLMEENCRLREDSSLLVRTNDELQRLLQGAGFRTPRATSVTTEGEKREVDDVPALGNDPDVPLSDASAHVQPQAKTAETLWSLALRDSRWLRLINDPDGLFGRDDLIDEQYEEYLDELLKLMERHGCSFKRAIELSESAETNVSGSKIDELEDGLLATPRISSRHHMRPPS